MAPEQLLGQPITHHVDIFAYGVTAYELLTGHKPFPGDTPAEILKLELDRSEFVPPREHNPEVPPNLERIILRCLETQPAQRHPLMGVMVRELKAALYL
jgi:serine/threonine-protein kinase